MEFHDLSNSNFSESSDFMNIDYILVYDISKDNSKEVNQIKRRTFERNLIKKGVKLSKIDGINEKTLCFVLMIVPWNLLLKFADAIKMKMPLKTTMPISPPSTIDLLMKYVPDFFTSPGVSELPHTHAYWSAFRLDKQEIFNMEPKNLFFTKSQKSLIANEILMRTQFSEVQEDIGIDRLIKAGVYLAAYPLHEGKSNADLNIDTNQTERQILHENWARAKRFYRYQPIQLIRD